MIGFDTETHLIAPGNLAPPMVCYTESAAGEVGGRLAHARFDRDFLIEHVADVFLEQDVIVGANTAYDAAVLLRWCEDLTPIIFRAYTEGRVYDVQLNQKLIDNAQGRLGGFFTAGGVWVEIRYSLAALVQRHLMKDRSAEKTDPNAWRLRYAELDNVPCDEWPEAASSYAVDDAIDARDVLEAQYKQRELWEHEAASQARAGLALHLLCVEGVHTDADTIRAVEELTVARFEDLTAELVKTGLVRPNGKRDTKKAKQRIIAAYRAQGIPFPLTDTGKKLAKERAKDLPSPKPSAWELLSDAEREKYAALDAVACEESGDDVLDDYAKRTSLATIVNTHIPDLWKGAGATPIQASFNPLLETGRVSCSKGRGGSTNGFQLTNPPRGLEVLCGECAGAGCKACKDVGEVPSEVDIRSCFVAEDGLVFIDGDFPGLELSTVAQACKIIVGYSRLGEALLEGIDVHLLLAARLLEITYAEALDRKHEKVVKDARQKAKPGNFGFWGGMGIDGFLAYTRKQKPRVRIPRELAVRIKDAWQAEFPETRAYFEWVREQCELGGGNATITQLYSNRIRGDVSYCAAANTMFQGLGADAAKDALYAITLACYDPTEESILYKSRPWNFVHDQILSKTRDVRDGSRDERAHRHAKVVEYGRIMSEACNRYLPDFPLEVKPHLSYAWQKNGEPVFDRDGLIVPWDYARAVRMRCFYEGGKEVTW